MNEMAEELASVEEVESEGLLDVQRVEHPGDDVPEDWHKDQAEALLEYRQSGRQGRYLDQSRDQEPDIAPEKGVAPHPELFNAAPPELRAPGIGEKSDSPVVTPVEEKEEFAEENPDTADEDARIREESLLSAPVGPPAQPVVIVDDQRGDANARAEREEAGSPNVSPSTRNADSKDSKDSKKR